MTEQDPTKDDGVRGFTGSMDVARSVGDVVKDVAGSMADVGEVGDGDSGNTLLDVSDIDADDDDEDENGELGTNLSSRFEQTTRRGQGVEDDDCCDHDPKQQVYVYRYCTYLISFTFHHSYPVIM